MKNKYKEAISKFCVSEELERKILDMTVNKEKKVRRTPRYAYVFGIILMICTFSIGLVFAEEIKTFFTSVSVHIGLGSVDGINFGNIHAVEINQNARRTKKSEYESMKISELEKEFGIDILTSTKSIRDEISYITLLSNKKIGRVILLHADFIDYPVENRIINELDKCLDEKRNIIKCDSSEEEYQKLASKRKFIAVHIDFLTQYAHNGFIAAFESGIFVKDPKDIKETYHIKSLNIDATIYNEKDNNGYYQLSAIFIYNDMLYNYISSNIPEKEFKEILDSLK